MLEKLIVRNYALIESIEVDFTDDFNILTGETGAGKSILVGALGLVLGHKSSKDTVRNGTQQAEVSAFMNLENSPEACQWLEEHDIPFDDDSVLVRRIVKLTGRGSCFIQSVPVTTADLAEFSSLVIDMHSQHQNQSLLRVDNYRKLLDRYAGIEDKVQELGSVFQQLSDMKKDYEQMAQSEQDRLREIDFLAYAVKEIDLLKLSEGEDDEIEAELKIITEHEKIAESLDLVVHSSGSEGALGLLRTALESIQYLSSVDSDYESYAGRFENAYYEIEDVINYVSGSRDSFDFSPQRLEYLQQRQADINTLKKKYGSTIAEILNYRDESEVKIEKLEKFDFSREELLKRISEFEKSLRSLAVEVSSARKAASVKLSSSITEKLKPLGMANAEFAVKIDVRAMEDGKPACGATGIDLVRFMISPNKGEPMKRLNDIASGGELSRVMLAVKSVFAEIDPIHTLIFDEIDSGIGGEVAVAVAKHMKNLSGFKQVICISHLAAIAASADSHIKIMKKSTDNKTVTEVFLMNKENRISEIARMLSGHDDSVSRMHAEKLINGN